MYEIPLILLVVAGIVWLADSVPWNYGGEMITPGGFTLDEPEDDPKHANLMFKKGGSAPAPDPLIGQAALENAQTGRDWLAFAEEQFAEQNKRQAGIDKLTKSIGQQQLETAKRADQWSQEDRARYQEVFQPLEDQLVETAKGWDSGERQAKLAAEAKADVLTNAQQQRAANRRSMAAMGIKPGSGRYAGVERASDFNTTLAGANAANSARNTVRQQGVAMRADAANMGRGLPSQAAQGASLGLQAGNSAQGQYLNAAGNARANASAMGQGFSGSIQGNNSAANIMNQQYGNQLQAWSANQQAAGAAWQGIGQLAGTAGTLALMSSEDYKTDKKKIGKSALEGIKNMRVENWKYKDGVGDGGGVEHTGTYAEDFQRETGKGDGKSIPIGDAIGVTMKAVQELDEKVTKALPKLADVKKAKGKSRSKGMA